MLTAFLEIGLPGGTVVDSVGMWRIVAHEIPIFAGLREQIAGHRPYNKTVFLLVPDEKVDDAIRAAEDVCGSFDEPGAGLVMVLPVARVKGYHGSPEEKR